MSLHIKYIHLNAKSEEKIVLQGLAMAVAATSHSLAKNASEAFNEGYAEKIQARHKRSSATILRDKLSQKSLKREMKEI